MTDVIHGIMVDGLQRWWSGFCLWSLCSSFPMLSSQSMVSFAPSSGRSIIRIFSNLEEWFKWYEDRLFKWTLCFPLFIHETACLQARVANPPQTLQCGSLMHWVPLDLSNTCNKLVSQTKNSILCNYMRQYFCFHINHFPDLQGVSIIGQIWLGFHEKSKIVLLINVQMNFPIWCLSSKYYGVFVFPNGIITDLKFNSVRFIKTHKFLSAI